MIKRINILSACSDSSNNSSCTSFSGSDGGVCRICHVVEQGRRNIRNKTKPVQVRSKTALNENVFINWIFQKFNFMFMEDRKQVKIDSSSEEELIAPCECRGTMRYVHRGCLNQWRMVSGRSDSFTRCEQCFASYTFKDTWITAILMHPATIYIICTLLFAAWVAASTFVSTGALCHQSSGSVGSDLFSLLPIIYFDSTGQNSLTSSFPALHSFIFHYNDFMAYFNGIFYGLVFVALTEYIFFTPSFILSFNTLFCIWRIQRYEIFFDKWLLIGFAGVGLWRAAKSLHGMIEAAITRIVKLKLLEVSNRTTEAEEEE